MNHSQVSLVDALLEIPTALVDRSYQQPPQPLGGSALLIVGRVAVATWEELSAAIEKEEL